MLEAGDVITAEEAERRVLVLENPALRGQSRITNRLSRAATDHAGRNRAARTATSVGHPLRA